MLVGKMFKSNHVSEMDFCIPHLTTCPCPEVRAQIPVIVIWGFFVTTFCISISLRKLTGSICEQTRQNLVNPRVLPKGHLTTIKTLAV